MLPLAHIGIVLFVASLLYLPLIAAMVGGILPDIVDKTLFITGLAPCGRFFAHSIFFGPIIAGISFLITRRKDLSLALLLGCYIHLILDMRYFLPWFYPLVQYTFYCPPIEIRPDLIAVVFEGIGVLLIPITFVLKPKIKHLKKLLIRKRKRVD